MAGMRPRQINNTNNAAAEECVDFRAIDAVTAPAGYKSPESQPRGPDGILPRQTIFRPGLRKICHYIFSGFLHNLLAYPLVNIQHDIGPVRIINLSRYYL